MALLSSHFWRKVLLLGTSCSSLKWHSRCCNEHTEKDGKDTRLYPQSCHQHINLHDEVEWQSRQFKFAWHFCYLAFLAQFPSQLIYSLIRSFIRLSSFRFVPELGWKKLSKWKQVCKSLLLFIFTMCHLCHHGFCLDSSHRSIGKSKLSVVCFFVALLEEAAADLCKPELSNQRVKKIDGCSLFLGAQTTVFFVKESKEKTSKMIIFSSRNTNSLSDVLAVIVSSLTVWWGLTYNITLSHQKMGRFCLFLLHRVRLNCVFKLVQPVEFFQEVQFQWKRWFHVNAMLKPERLSLYSVKPVFVSTGPQAFMFPHSFSKEAFWWRKTASDSMSHTVLD